jgi:N-dimethylarginine dimethylaminohydrolase
MTAHSEYGILKEVFIKTAKAAFINQNVVDEQWKDLNFLDKPDFQKALEEYEEFETLLKSEGTKVSYFPENIAVTMDSMYCRDASIVTDFGVIICNMGKIQRIPEAEASKAIYLENGIKILGTITASGKIEGGDVAWLDQKTLAIGHGYRTNDEGFRQMKNLLEPLGIELIQVDLPHYKGENDVFHLMSIFSPVDAKKAVVYSPLMPVRFRSLLIERGFELIEVPDEEFESMGCNVLAIAPSKCLMVKGNPITKSRLEAAGCTILEYHGSEISVKGGGGPTCLTRPVLRVE